MDGGQGGTKISLTPRCICCFRVALDEKLRCYLCFISPIVGYFISNFILFSALKDISEKVGFIFKQ